MQDSDTGTPQGGILSPLLANIALYVLDEHVMAPWQPDGEMGTTYRRHAPSRQGPADLADRPLRGRLRHPRARHQDRRAKPCAKTSPTCWHRWGCGCRRPRPGSCT